MKWQKIRLPWKNLICLGLMLVSMLGIVMIQWNEINTFRMVNNDSLHYVRGYVESVDSEQLELDTLEPDRQVGVQQLTVKLLAGTEQGKSVSVTNYVTRTLNVVAKQGMTIMICVDQPENAEPYYTVFNYHRVPGLIFTVAIFAVIVLAVGRGKGGWSLLGLGYTVFVILFFLVQAIFHGWSVMGSVVATIAVGTIAALVLLGGIGRKTFAAAAATLLGTALSGVLFLLFSKVLHISDYLAMELAQGIAATGGVVLTVPVASVISALVYTREKKKA